MCDSVVKDMLMWLLNDYGLTIRKWVWLGDILEYHGFIPLNYIANPTNSIFKYAFLDSPYELK